MMKKGISPLIATVLILGFTVALAAVIMTWGTSFTRQMQQSTEESSLSQIDCATDVNFKIKDACLIGGQLKLVVSNDAARDLEDMIVRVYESSDTVGQATLSTDTNQSGKLPLPAFGIAPIFLQEADAIGVNSSLAKQIEIIPKIKLGAKVVTCSSSVAQYGDTAGTILLPCS